MPALAASDAERLLRFVAEAEGIGDDQPFTGELLVGLGRLIEDENGGCCSRVRDAEAS